MEKPSTIATEAKDRLDYIIQIGRVDLYKPIHIAEVLRRSRLHQDINVSELESFRNPSLKWRDIVTQLLLSKKPTSSARYQHDVWNESAMPPRLLFGQPWYIVTPLMRKKRLSRDGVEQEYFW